jgi:YebC/PmpR family DNA-binding regulatory protein
MSGHSHWAGIKYKKAKVDAQRGKVFSRVAKQIMTAVRQGGKDPDTNLELRYAIDAARAANMPKDKIDYAVKKGAGEIEGRRVESVRYEGYGPGGAAVMVEALTDNRNRTTPHVRKIFDDHGGQLAGGGSVSWQFETRGLVLIELGERSFDELFELAVEAGAEDVQEAGEYCEVVCEPKDLHELKQALEAAELAPESAEITQVPKAYVDLDQDDGRKMVKLMEEMEEDEDVTNVYSNFNLPEALVAELAG